MTYTAEPLCVDDGYKPAAETEAAGDNSLLIVLPLTFWKKDGELMIESQARHGLDEWAKNFSWVTVAALVVESQTEPDPNWKWVPVSELQHRSRIELIELPMTYKLIEFAPVYQKMRKRLAEQIQQHRYLQFAIGGLFGDWGAIAGLEAAKQNRKFAVWADRIEHQVVARTSGDRFGRKLTNLIRLPLMRCLEKSVISKSSVGLFNGNETFQYYREFVSDAYKVHDIHVAGNHYIGATELAAKQQRIESAAPLKICYSGRADAMKAPLDWIAALSGLNQAGIEFSATWMGGGKLFAEMQNAVQKAGLEDKIQLPGFIESHKQVMEIIRESDLFLFTHTTPESPRCLIEALISGTAIVGYGSLYSEDLVETHGGGKLVAVNAVDDLVKLLRELHGDRPLLSLMTQEAARSGRQFNDEEAFTLRRDLIKKFQ